MPWCICRLQLPSHFSSPPSSTHVHTLTIRTYTFCRYVYIACSMAAPALWMCAEKKEGEEFFHGWLYHCYTYIVCRICLVCVPVNKRKGGKLDFVNTVEVKLSFSASLVVRLLIMAKWSHTFSLAYFDRIVSLLCFSFSPLPECVLLLASANW